LTPDINTDATARDMDLIRHLLGEDKLNFIGLSYGTWLGNWYASLFPQRVGHMLLSGVTDFSEPLNHQTLQQEGGMQRVLDEVLIPYAVAHPQRFGNLAATADELRAMLGSLPNSLHYATVSTLSETHSLSESTLADVAVMTLLATKVIQAQLLASPGIDESTLTKQLAAYSFSPQQDLNDNANFAAAAILRSYFLQVGEKPAAKDESMFWAVVCNDTGTGFTPQSWVLASNLSAALYKDFGGYMRDNACLYWTQSGITRPSQDRAASAGAILLLQAELDPLTVLTGAHKSLSLLPNARMIEITGEYSHAPLPPYGTGCVDKPIAQYFLDGTQSANTSCNRRSLAAER
jgi:pimeloyl-ACP methyl ester carboxylesterase